MEYEKKIVSALQKYPENKLTKNIIIPLFENIGYYKVEFHGGQSEEGKDIVIWDKDKLGDIKLSVAQVKHFKFTNKASGNNSFQTVVNQLGTSSVKELPYIDGTTHLPSELFLITTYEVETKTLLTHFSTQPRLKDQFIRIIDGKKLASLLIKHKPEFVKELIGLEFEISTKLKPKFDNDILLRALGARKIKDIKTIYSDIDFSIGKITTNLFFNSEFDAKVETIGLEKEEWEFFKELCAEIKKEFKLNFLEADIETIEKKNELVALEFDKLEKQIISFKSEINFDKENLDSLHKERNTKTKILNEIEIEIEEIRANLEEDESKKKEFEREKKLQLLERSKTESKEKNALNVLKTKISKIENDLFKKDEELNKLKTKKSKLRYNVELDGEKLAVEMNAKRLWIENMVKEYNDNKPTPIALNKFVEECNSIIDSASKIFDKKNSKFFNCLGFERDRKIRDNFESTRFRLSIDLIFNTGMNISVLGDAGSGKSTSLEMYAWNKKDSNKIVIFAPLGYVVKEYSLIHSIPDISNKIGLDVMLSKYMERMGVQISLPEFQYILTKEKVILLLDGLDEAIKIAPNLPESIQLFAKKFPNIQIILSSRMHGAYIEKIPFFTVTLLPFTIKQRNVFIEKWFKDEVDCETITTNIIKHLSENESISEIIRNPLLTTTLCVLAEHNLTLPKTEIHLYDERLRLFTGYYDNVKRIVIRISSKPNTLEILAQKLAFYLHCNNTREENLEILKENALRLLANQVDEEGIKTAFDELMDPCEILIPMSPDGKYGFGHLRYQEHLVAKELLKRSVDIFPYLTQDWWESPLLLFARMNDDLEWLIKEIGDHKRISIPIVSKIIRTKPKYEKIRLQSLVEKYVLLETGDYSDMRKDFNLLDEQEDSNFF